jgi:ATP-dependent DNA ligase
MRLPEKALAHLHEGLQKIKIVTCPFVNLPEKRRGRWAQGIIPAAMKRCHWVEPTPVAQITFTEGTLDDQLRQPVFLELRTDKEAKDVIRESLQRMLRSAISTQQFGVLQRGRPRRSNGPDRCSLWP